MKIRYWLGLVQLGVLLAMVVGSGAAAPLPPGARGGELTAELPFKPEEVVSLSAATIAPFGGKIDVAVTANDESDPAVALCASNQYLVVYERGSQIYGQRLTDEGELLGSAFLVSDDVKPASKPDVVCEWTNDYFVVVWESEYTVGDDDIRAQAVYGSHQGSGSQLQGSWMYITSSSNNEQNPAVACNSADQTCLVVYENESSGNRSVDGRRVAVSVTGITTPQGAFAIASNTQEYEPDVAWAESANNFLVVWQHWFVNVDPPSHFVLTYRRIYDTHQAGNQWQEPAYGLIRGTCGGYNNDQTEPAVAYSRGAGEYLVAFQYDRNAAGNHDVAVLRMRPSTGNLPDCPFFVAESAEAETSPAVAYSGGPEHFTDKHGNPQFLVAYVREEAGEMALFAQGVKDRDDGSGIDLDGSPEELDRTSSASGGGVVSPDVTGSAHNGRYLTVWQHNTEKDILGHLVAPYGGALSIAGTSFVSADSGHSYEYASWGGVKLTGVGASPWPFMIASVELPEGVTIASVTLYYYDNAEVTEYIQLELMRCNRTGTCDGMAPITSANDGTSSKTNSSVVNAVVDNANYSYALSAGIYESGAADLILYGAKIAYIPNVNAPIGPFSVTSPPPSPPEGVAVSVSGIQGEAGPVLHSGGQLIFLAPPSPADLEASGEGERESDAVAAPPASTGLRPLGGGSGTLDWRRYTVAGANFHPAYSNIAHSWTSGGGRYVDAAPTLANLVAPLNLIHGKTIQHARFTYYDNSTENPGLYLYQVDRQGSGSLIWSYTPDASGGYFTAVSPRLGQVVDNQNYAYYFIARLGSPAVGSNLKAMEVEISYITEAYLPILLKSY